tara:strand:- start:379 stop:1749 length:1371 start_codon:yes stop_codon:yes gene_type:complete
MNLNEYEKIDREYLIHPMTHLAKFERGEIDNRIMKTARGVEIIDAQGNSFIDAFSGLYCVNVGYGCTDIIDAIKKQAEELAYYHCYYGNATEASIKLSDMVIERSPNNMKKIYFGLSGSDANDTNIKLLWYYNNLIGHTKKKKIISRRGGYHGASIFTGSLTGIETYHFNYDLPIEGILHTEDAFYFHRADLDQTEDEYSQFCADQLEELILKENPDTIAGFIAEPVIGNGGLVPPPHNYWPRIKNVLEKYNIALISDEVVTGFGRLGKMFGVDYFGIEADMITVAKGITSAYSPLSGSILSEKISNVIRDATDKYGVWTHGSTYSAHPISCAAGVANLNHIDNHQLIKKGKDISKYFNFKLKEKFQDHPQIGDVRGIGLLSAIELVKDKKNRKFFEKQGQLSQEIVMRMAKNGVLARAMPAGDTIGFAPAFCINNDEIDTILDVTLQSIDEIINN